MWKYCAVHTRPQNRPSHLAGSVFQVVLDLVLRLEMRHGSGVVPAVLVTTTLHAAVDKVLDARLDSAVDHRFTLSDLALMSDALALRDLHAVDAPDRTAGDLSGAREQCRHVVHVALDEFDVAALGCELLRRGAGGVAGDGEESEVGVVGQVVNYGSALLASGAGDEDSFRHGCEVVLWLCFAFDCCVGSNERVVRSDRLSEKSWLSQVAV